MSGQQVQWDQQVHKAQQELKGTQELKVRLVALEHKDRQVHKVMSDQQVR